MAHCRGQRCTTRSPERPCVCTRCDGCPQCCACTCQRCYEADTHGVHVHVHPYAAAATTSDGWPPVAPVVQVGQLGLFVAPVVQGGET